MPRRIPRPDFKATPEQAAAVLRVMDKFDFEKVHKAMVAVGWKWTTHNPDDPMELAIPDVDRIKDSAADLMWDCYEWLDEDDADGSRVASGGFTATLDKDGTISLEFVLEEAGSED